MRFSNDRKSGRILSSCPIDEVLPDLKEAIRRHSAVILQAPPGSGKTTRVPIALLDVMPPGQGRILMLEPRRIAAVSAARWMAKMLGEEIGQTLGYSIRFDSRVSLQTRIEVVTEGVLTRRILTQPTLPDIAMVIFDEFHERSLQTDLALALCLDIRRALRVDLKILVMSATLDSGPVSALLDGAPIITAQGHTYPVEERYCGDRQDQPVTRRVTDVIRRALRETSGDILVFLPGEREIRTVSERLTEMMQSGAINRLSLHPLYGNLPFEEQERAILPAAERKIILSTNIAETSLTIEGVRVVIDCGLTRRIEYDPATGMNRLATVNISQSQARQRKGRAGRLEPGICYRLYSAHTFSSFLAFALPEIVLSDLTDLVLDLADWGVKNPAMLSWLDEPPSRAWESAQDLLKELGALDHSGAITKEGKAMARLPVHPRLGRLILKASQRGCSLLGTDLAALLSERDILRLARLRDAHTLGGFDLSDRVALLHKWRKEKKPTAETDLSALKAVDAVSRQLWRLLNKTLADFGEVDSGMIARLLLFAFPDRIAQKREEDEGRYVLRSGRGVKLAPKSLAAQSPYIIAVVVDHGEKALGTVHVAEPLSEEILRLELAGEIEIRERLEWNRQEGRVTGMLEERLGAMLLSARPFSPTPEEIAILLCDAIRSRMVKIPFSPKALQFQARLRLIRWAFPEENWPDVSEEALLENPRDWIIPWISGIRSAEELAALDILPALQERLSWEQRRRLQERAPVSILVPSGHNIPIDYVSGTIPVLAVKLQEMFGLPETPAIAEGRVRLLLHLLSPARRPVQITQDLKQFWMSGYPQVKKELKGRYPKHPWPDDPWNATPTRKTRSSSG